MAAAEKRPSASDMDGLHTPKTMSDVGAGVGDLEWTWERRHTAPEFGLDVQIP